MKQSIIAALLGIVIWSGLASPAQAKIDWLDQLTRIINLTTQARRSLHTETTDNSGTFNTTDERCLYCHRVISGKKHMLNDGYVCKSCLERHLPKCCCCHGPIRDGYVEYYDGNYCCLKCYQQPNLRRCAECNCPTREPELAQGGVVCSRHRRGAVCQEREAEEIWYEVDDAYAEIFGDEFLLDTMPQIHMMTLQELQKAGRTDSEWVKAFSRTNIGGGHYVHDMYMLKGMSHNYLLEQLAHEGAHCWHYENQPRILACRSDFKEGFCEWVAYKVLSHLGLNKQCERQLNNAEIEYSKGLRDFLVLEKKLGSPCAVLDYMRDNTSL